LATQNPIEQEGTFNLPEAQLDRFLLKTIVDYPTEDEELEILKNIKQIETTQIRKICNKQDIFNIQNLVENIYTDENILEYIKNIVFYTRKKNTTISKYLAYPVSPRASLALLKTSKTLAFLSGRDFVIPEDIKEMAYPVLRHRIILNYEALAEEVQVDQIIKNILDNVEVK
jgi:MoxR-like ATPase